MHVTLCSIFRNSAHYLKRYMDQVDALRDKIDVRVVGTWGDSTDNTRLMLKHWDIDLGEHHHGGDDYGSVDHPARWDQIASVVRYTLDRVGDPGDALIWVEADLIWQAHAMLGLLDDLEEAPAVAPMVFAARDALSFVDRFYDTWGFRQGGMHFAGHPPYFHAPPDPATGLVKIDSCGSCFAVSYRRSDLWKEWSGHWPFPAGGELWLDPRLKVRHP